MDFSQELQWEVLPELELDHCWNDCRNFELELSLERLLELQPKLLLDERLEIADDLGAGPILGGDKFAAEDAVFVDDVAFGDLAGSVEGLDAGGGVADGEEIDVVLLEEALVLVGIFILTDGDDDDLGKLVLEGEQAGKLLDAGGAPGGPEVDDDDMTAEAGEIGGVGAVGEVEGECRAAYFAGVIAAVAAGCHEKGEKGTEDGRKESARGEMQGELHVPIIRTRDN